MGRPLKNTAEYFPHYVKVGSTLYILEQKWGNDGYAFWYKLHELLCTQEGHYYDCSKEANCIYLSAYTRIDNCTVENIICTLAELGEIDKELWKNDRIIWCQSLVNDLKPLYDKRTSKLPEKPIKNNNIEEKTENNIVSATETGDLAPKKKSSKKEKPPKIKYAEFVTMTQEEHDKLVSEYGQEKTDRMITVLDNYKGSKGKSYKNDYRAILSWVVDKIEEESNRGGNCHGQNDTRQQTGDFNDFVPSQGFKKW